jgi:acetyltransferase-like isoleucine patch superfamily enzyme
MSIVRAIYKRLRGRSIPDDVPAGAMGEFVIRKGVEAVRGLAYGTLYGSRIQPHFRGRGVQVLFPRSLAIGRGVAFGDRVRIEAYCRQGVVLGDNVTIGAGALVAGSGVIAEPGEFVKVGSRTAVGINNVIWGQGGVTIGEDCLLGPNVVVVSENHASSSLEIPIRQQGSVRAPIVIGNDCWIGAGAKILAGVTVGSGSIVGAGAVVTSDVPPRAIVVGVPGKIVAFRGAKPANA